MLVALQMSVREYSGVPMILLIISAGGSLHTTQNTLSDAFLILNYITIVP